MAGNKNVLRSEKPGSHDYDFIVFICLCYNLKYFIFLLHFPFGTCYSKQALRRCLNSSVGRASGC